MVSIFFLLSLSFPSFLSHTDTDNTQPRTEWNWREWGPISCRCSEKQYGQYHISFVSVVYIFSSSHRHWPHSTSHEIESVTIEPKMLLMPWKIIRSISLFFYFSRLHLFFLLQKLTTLDLEQNKIGEKGAQYLADFLKNNTVNIFFLLSPLFEYFPSHSDSGRTQPQIQRH